jgi:hypothetical protein
MSSETYYVAAGQEKPIKLKDLEEGKYYILMKPVLLHPNYRQMFPSLQKKIDELAKRPIKLLTSTTEQYDEDEVAVPGGIISTYLEFDDPIVNNIDSIVLPDERNTLFYERPTPTDPGAPGAPRGGKRKSKKTRKSKKSKRTRKY